MTVAPGSGETGGPAQLFDTSDTSDEGVGAAAAAAAAEAAAVSADVPETNSISRSGLVVTVSPNDRKYVAALS